MASKRSITVLLCSVVVLLTLSSVMSVSMVSAQSTQIFQLHVGKGAWAEYNVDEVTSPFSYAVGDRIRIDILDIAVETLSVQSQSVTTTISFEIANMSLLVNGNLQGYGFNVLSFAGSFINVFYPTDYAFWNAYASLLGFRFTSSAGILTALLESNTYTRITNETTGEIISESWQYMGTRVDVEQSTGMMTRLEFRINDTTPPYSNYQCLVISCVGSSVSSQTFSWASVSIAISVSLSLVIAMLGAVTVGSRRKGKVRGATKDEVLRNLSKEDLLKLASAASRNPVSDRTSREDLVNIVKSSMSLEEIKNKL